MNKITSLIFLMVFSISASSQFLSSKTDNYAVEAKNYIDFIPIAPIQIKTRVISATSNNEIKTMALDPIKWLNDYKVNSTYRTVFNRQQDPIQSEDGVFSLNSDEESYATQIFLMGDGSTDTSSAIYNQVYPSGNANLTLNNISEITDISIN